MIQLSMKNDPPFALTYLSALTGPFGLFQHAAGATPRLEEGYCTDDNARLLQLLAETGLRSELNGELYLKAWEFLCEAQTPAGLFRNFRAADGTWLDEEGTQDTVARVARGLAAVMAHDSDRERTYEARDMLEKLLTHLEGFTAKRALAEGVIALTALPSDLASVASQATGHALWKRLWESWQVAATSDWPWPERQLTYANALLPHGLLAGVLAFPEQAAAAMPAVHMSAQFLINETIRDGLFVPIGNEGWYRQKQERAMYDQQPIEAHTMFDFLLAYAPQAALPLPVETIAAPYLWFYGHNTRQTVMADREGGFAYDGLNADGPNQNQGAESQLAYLRSELLLKQAPAILREDADRRRQALKLQLVSAMSPT